MGEDPFQVLGIPEDATLEEARAAYRRLAALFHPDRLEGMRDEVRAEGAQRMREATRAMRTIRDRYARPLVAPGRQRSGATESPSGVRSTGTQGPRKRDPPARDTSSEQRPRRPRAERTGPAGRPVPAGQPPEALKSPPSDAATESAAHMYHAQLRSLDGPGLHVSWDGRHASATLAALRHAHTIDGPIRQVEWGSYEWVLDGAATRRLLLNVLDDEDWRRDPAQIDHMSSEISNRLLPARRSQEICSTGLGAVPDLLDDERWYCVVAEVY